MNNFKKITCPDCGGEGKIDAIVKYFTCPTCKGQPLYQRLEPIEVPDGYEFEDIFPDNFEDKAYFANTKSKFGKVKGQRTWDMVGFKPPHKVGETIKEVCACENGLEYFKNTRGNREIGDCPSCNGNPEQSSEVLSIEVIKIEDKWYFDVRVRRV